MLISDTCDGIVSVFRVQADTCGRLWVLDSGQIHITIEPKQICHPKVLVFDLETDQLLLKYEFPAEFVKQDSLYSNILVDIREEDCENAHAYIVDVWRFGLVVYSWSKDRAWRITDHLFYPDPLAARYKLHDIEFDWTDGIFGLALSPYSKLTEDRLLYFHPMSSFREFYVKTSVICNETGWMDAKNAFKVIGQSRGPSGHVSASAIDRNGIMFYNLVTRDTIGCWDTRKAYKRQNLGVVAQDHRTLIFPNDLKIDMEKRQSVWIITNGLPYYLYRGLDEHKINFRILSAFIDESINGTICDPAVGFSTSFIEYEEEDCY